MAPQGSGGWQEPAHPMVMRLHEDLHAIYGYLREKYQAKIDQMFDKVSKRIGFVVTTTLPVVLEAGPKGAVKGGIIIEGEQLQGTLFDEELKGALKGLAGATIAGLSPGTHRFYLLWFQALKVKLQTDWIEPAHLARGLPGKLQPPVASASGKGVFQDIREPAHWFDPGVAIAAEEAVLISVIDEVYPELRLVERITRYRGSALPAVNPEVMEPAHSRTAASGIAPRDATEVLKDMAALLRKSGY